MIDYGAIAFKNGKLISTEMSTSMITTCGFSDKNKLLPGRKSPFDGNFSIVIGDKTLVIGFFKTYVAWWYDCFPDEKNPEARYDSDGEYFGFSEYVKWKKWEKDFYIGLKNHANLTVKHKNGYYVAKLKFNGDNYKIYFGYGVDFDFYKKTKRVNYYRSPEYLIKSCTITIIHKLKTLIKGENYESER